MAKSGQARGRRLTFVIADECIDRCEIYGRRNVNRVQGPQSRFGERSRSEQERSVERQQRQSIEYLARTIEQLFKGQPRVSGSRAPDRAWQLS
jgi:hypothetical protein